MKHIKSLTLSTKHLRITMGLTLTVVLGGGLSFLAADPENNERNNSFTFALLGDVPYAPTSGTAPTKVQTYPSQEYNDVITDINNHDVMFTAHVGDIKAGDTLCVGGNTAKDPATAANVYTNNFALFSTFLSGVVYLPGDNEWTDCHRTNNGTYNPQERLSYIRKTFFVIDQTLGKRHFTVKRQSSDPGFALYSENVMWQIGGIVFVGINQPGSNNNHQRNITASVPPPADDNEGEYTARNAANIAWINKAFDLAGSSEKTRAVVIMQQGNVFERFLESGQGYLTSGYEGFVATLRTRTVAFGKPVVLVAGDTHTVRIDKPLTTLYPGHCTPVTTTCLQQAPATSSPIVVSSAGTRIQNFTRVEVFGSPDAHWVRVVVDPNDPNVFSFGMQTIPGTGRGHDDDH